jgi:hypothetical protein
MKKPYPFLITILIVISLFNACKSDYRNAIEESAQKYPELYRQNPANSFNVVRTLIDKKLNITMTLLQSGDQQVVVLTDNKRRMTSVPFPDNDNCGYWQFCQDSLKTHRYFKAAVNNCFKNLAIKGWSDQYLVMDDILISLIGARPLMHADSARLKFMIRGECGQDSVKTGLSYQTAISSMKAYVNLWDYTTYSDMQHARVYQIDTVNNNSLVLSVYKQPCVLTHLFRL